MGGENVENTSEASQGKVYTIGIFDPQSIYKHAWYHVPNHIAYGGNNSIQKYISF